MKYIIIERYQKWSNTGKEWTNWFTSIGNPKFDSYDTAKLYIKEKLKPLSSYIDSKTKLKHEWDIIEILKENLIVAKPKYKRIGRPTKAEKQEFTVKLEDYNRRFEYWKTLNIVD